MSTPEGVCPEHYDCKDCLESEQRTVAAATSGLVKALEEIQKRALHYDKREAQLPDGQGGYGVLADLAFDALARHRGVR